MSISKMNESTMNWNSNNMYLVRITFVLPEKYRLEWGGGRGAGQSAMTPN